jgi:hypothetical protein
MILVQTFLKKSIAFKKCKFSKKRKYRFPCENDFDSDAPPTSET